MKKIFLLLLIIGIAISFPLAVFADDDDDDDYLVDASCPYYVIIEADVVYYPDIASLFPDGCNLVYLSVDVDSRYLNVDDDDYENSPTLRTISETYEAMVPSTMLVCPVCADGSDDPEFVITAYGILGPCLPGTGTLEKPCIELIPDLTPLTFSSGAYPVLRAERTKKIMP